MKHREQIPLPIALVALPACAKRASTGRLCVPMKGKRGVECFSCGAVQR